jgi:hypothetical protein
MIRKEITIVVTALLLVACSGGDESQSVVQQKIDNPEATNDNLAPSKNQLDTNAEAINLSTDSKSPFGAAQKPVDETDSEPAVDPYQDDVESLDGELALNQSEVGYLEWSAPEDIAYTQAEIVITGANGSRLSRSFVPGEAIVVDDQLPDGHYLWESVVTPEIDPYVREQMSEIRASGNYEEQQALIAQLRAEGSLPTEAEARNNRKSGSFLVRDGIATPIPPSYLDNEPQRDGSG